MARPVDELITRLGFEFQQAPEMWRQALTHRSAEGQPHYERLEYLGDAVLKLVVSQILYERYPGLDEGDMTKVRARAVSDETLAKVAHDLKLGDHLVLGPAEKRTQGKNKVGILASSLEALLGVIYLQEGYDAAFKFLDTWLAEELDVSIKLGGLDNYKAVLQELTQSRFKSLPEYRLMAEIGPEHDRAYELGVWIEGECRGVGRGRSKKSAEQKAAAQALESLSQNQKK